MTTSMQSIQSLVPDTLTITVERTVQIPKFNPIGVSITETYTMPRNVDMESVRKVLTRNIGASIELAINREMKRYAPPVAEPDEDQD